MLKHSRKVMLQRKNKPLAQDASETLGVGADERQEAAQAGQCALDHEKPENNQADQACCDSVATPNAVLLPHGIVDFSTGNHHKSIVLYCETDEERNALSDSIMAEIEAANTKAAAARPVD